MFNVAIFETNGSVINQAMQCSIRSSKQNTSNDSKQLQWSIQNVTIGFVPLSSHTCPASIVIQANIYDETLVLHKKIL